MDVPGTGMSGTDPLLAQLMGRGKESEARIAGVEKDVGESRAREDAARAKQQTAMQPTQDKLKAALDAGGPAAPQPAALPEAPKRPELDTKEMTETLSLITALAALGGALTRQPLTAALNNFSSGVHGLVQGKEMIFQNAIKEFDSNLKKAHAENAAQWQKYQAARDKYKTDITGLQNELKLIAAETQSPIDLELARRGDVVSLMKMREKSASDFDKVLASVSRIRTQQETHAEAVRHHKELETAARDRIAKMGAGHGSDPAKREDALQKEFGAAKRKLHDRLLTKKIDQATYDQELAMLTGQMKGRGMGGAAAPGAPASPAAPAAPKPPTKDAEGRLVFAGPADLEAAAATLEDGTPIVVNGVPGKWKK